ncbi:MAG: hypothetical protein H6R14_2317 [Proteobacteria bacterium]|nr:hypothetical protein [Pseudomonadota bacterium]
MLYDLFRPQDGLFGPIHFYIQEIKQMRLVHSILLSSLLAAASAHAQNAKPPACPFEPAYLSAQLGETFQAGVPERAMIGMGCKYKGKNADFWIDAGPNPAPSAEMWQKMASPPGTTFTPVANDPDKAVHVNAAPSVSPFPSLFYERKGWLVSITVTGVSGKKAIDAWNAKLAGIKRIP